MLRKIRLLFFLPFFLFAEDLEVRLSTNNPLPGLYLSDFHLPTSEYDWRAYKELKEVFEFDLLINGSCSLVQANEKYENLIKWPDVKNGFSILAWKSQGISYVLAAQIVKNQLQLVVFDIEKGASKKYPDVPLSNRLEEDRRQIHKLADLVQKDLFGIEGIASRKILYSQRKKAADDWVSEIWIADADGANEKRILREKGYCLSPKFFPSNLSKQDFYYVTYKNGQSKIYRSSLDKTDGESMVELRGSQALPAMNRQGTQIAFISDAAGRPDLFIQNLDAKGIAIGKAKQLFSAPRATQASPTYSPDGKRLAFVSDKDGSPRIFVLNLSKSSETSPSRPILLTKKNRENTSPAWSPDGKKIAYSAKVEGVRQIWIYDLETEEEFPLTTGAEHKENPSWALNSFHLVYNTENEDNSELYLIDLTRKEPILISKGPDQKRFACFER